MQKQLKRIKSRKVNNPAKMYINLVLQSFLIQTVLFFLSCILGLILDIKSNNFYIFCIISLSSGSLISGFFAGRKTKKKGLLNGILYVLPANIIFILFSLVFNGFKVDYMLLISLILLVIFSAVGGVISVNFRPKINIKNIR